MRAIILENGHYILQQCSQPEVPDGHVLIKVAYAGVNRADCFQKAGKYPLPALTPAIPGMEVSGEIVRCGKTVKDFKPGDKVCALMSEGAFAEYVSVPQALVLSVPSPLDLEQAAALPEACFTVWISLVWQAKIKTGETVLIHGGASGIGNMAVQIAHTLGARVFATAGTNEKCKAATQAGAEKVINYNKEDYVARIKEFTRDQGVNVILDVVGGDYFGRNLECLAHSGRLCIIAFLKGSKITANMSPILFRHLSIMGSTLRSRPESEKAQIAVELRNNLWHKLEKGQIKPVIDKIFPLESAEKALIHMEQGLNIGKILIKMQS